MKKHEISQQQMMAIINYLIKHPFEEVHQLVDLIRGLKEIKENDKQEALQTEES